MESYPVGTLDLMKSSTHFEVEILKDVATASDKLDFLSNQSMFYNNIK